MMNVAVIGVGGYTGLELIKMLVHHPKFNLTYIANTQGGVNLSSLHPSLKDVIEMDVNEVNIELLSNQASLVFLALPHTASMKLVKPLLENGLRVVDLSADYRLQKDTYELFYCPHEDPENLEHSVYGLPEFFYDKICNAKLIANPGCYPTASLLALLPFMDYIDESCPVIIDAKSGVSGAGKTPSAKTHYCHINDNTFAYNPFKHRHSPEIKEKIFELAHKQMDVSFIPHLLPITRGMLVSVYAVVKKECDVNAVLKQVYGHHEFIRLKTQPVDMKSTAGTNFCDIYAQLEGNTLFVTASIDNLLRGASSQAMVNANIMCGYESRLGIPTIAYVP